MSLPTKKYVLFPVLWLILLITSIAVLKIPSSTPTSGLLNWLQEKRLQARQDRGIKLLNMNMSNLSMYQSLLKMNMNESETNKPPAQIMEYMEQVIDVMPSMAPAYSVLGLCYYSLGSKDKAYEFFQKSFLLDPQNFWSIQNLAILALEAHQNIEAEKFFKMALSQDPRYVLKTLSSSKIYSDILIADPSYSPSTALQENYLKATQALYWLHNKKSFDAHEIGLHIRIF